MRIGLLGVGAIGGFVGARLGQAGHDIVALARGDTLAALRADGIQLVSGDKRHKVPVTASNDPRELGAVDVLFISVKAPSLSQVAPAVPFMVRPDTVIVPAMNGVPWWFFMGQGSNPECDPRLADLPLASIDRDGVIAANIPFAGVIGCVVHMACAQLGPGIIKHNFGQRFILGEPAGGAGDRVKRVAALLRQGGFDVDVSANVRQDTWYKLWGNMTMNPVSAMTGATSDRVLDDPLVNEFCLRVMAEAAGIGARIGCAISESGEARNAVTRKLGAFKTSMLQDVEARRPIELDALVTVVKEIAGRLDLPCPNLDALLGLTRLFAQSRQLYQGPNA